LKAITTVLVIKFNDSLGVDLLKKVGEVDERASLGVKLAA